MKEWYQNKNKFRWCAVALAFLQIIGFFLFPFATMMETGLGDLTGLGGLGGLGGLTGLSGGSSVFPNRITGWNMLRFMLKYISSGIGVDEVLIIVGVPLLIGMALAVAQLFMNIYGRKKGTYILTLIFGVLQTAIYIFGTVMGNVLSEGSYGFYQKGFAPWILIPAAIGMVTVAIIALIMDRNLVGAAVAKGKKDGVLIGVNGAYAGARIPIHSGETIMIGRDPGMCNIVLKGGSTSRKHCAVQYDSERKKYRVTDYSSNGVFDKQGKRLARGWADLMNIGDEIRIGNSVDVFRFG